MRKKLDLGCIPAFTAFCVLALIGIVLAIMFFKWLTFSALGASVLIGSLAGGISYFLTTKRISATLEDGEWTVKMPKSGAWLFIALCLLGTILVYKDRPDLSREAIFALISSIIAMLVYTIFTGALLARRALK